MNSALGDGVTHHPMHWVASAKAAVERGLGVLQRGDPLVALVLSWLVLLYVQNGSPSVIGVDGYYHIKFAWLMREHGLKLDFPWLPLTILNPQDFTDHHWLFHLLLIPFTFGDLRVGAKAAALVFAVVTVMTVYLVLTRLRVRYPLLWLVVLLASGEWFLARLSMTRRQSLALALLVLATYLLARGRFRWLLPLAFAYGWLFDGFVMLIAVVSVAFAARFVADRQLAWPIFGWTLLGLGLAMVTHPYFPNNVTFTYLHMLPKVVPEAEVRVGAEWYPYVPRVLIETSWLPLLLIPLGLLPCLLAPRRFLRDHIALLLAGLALLFVAMYLRSRRYIESEPAFAVLFCAYAWSFFSPVVRGRSPGEWLPPRARQGLAALALLGLGLQAFFAIQTGHRAVNTEGHHYTTFETAAPWLAQNSEPGELIFHTDWDDFPELFFYNTHNTYIVGLDPTYMYLERPQQYLRWRRITRGAVDRPSRAIREEFGARWVITDRTHAEFIVKALGDPDMQVAFQAPGAVVFRVRGAKEGSDTS
jgi:hypothetical protein